jgi:hypothetical protein
MAILVLGCAGVFWWQRSQIISLRAQVARQDAALGESQERMDGFSALLTGGGRMGATAFPAVATRADRLRETDRDSAVLRADERRVILNQYRDVLAKMDLSPGNASRLGDLLTDRIEAFMDAQDAALREGFAEGSAETGRAVALAIAEDDRAIANLLGPDASRRMNGLLFGPAPEPVVAPEAAPAPVVVNVVVQAPQAPQYADAAWPAADSSAYAPYNPYYLYPSSGFYVVGAPARRFAGARPGAERPNRHSIGPRTHRS